MEMSKTKFKAHALEVFRTIEKTGESLVITDHGSPKIEIRKISQKTTNPLNILRNSVLSYHSATDPVDIDEWENA